MHLGNLWSALLAWLAARSRGGRMVLRLEDLDPDRCTQERCDQVMWDLEWLGLDWDGEPVYQSRRTDAYRAAFARLEEAGCSIPATAPGRSGWPPPPPTGLTASRSMTAVPPPAAGGAGPPGPKPPPGLADPGPGGGPELS